MRRWPSSPCHFTSGSRNRFGIHAPSGLHCRLSGPATLRGQTRSHQRWHRDSHFQSSHVSEQLFQLWYRRSQRRSQLHCSILHAWRWQKCPLSEWWNSWRAHSARRTQQRTGIRQRGQHMASTFKNVGAPPEHWAMCQTAHSSVIVRDLFIEHVPSTSLWAHMSSGVAGSHILAHRSPASTPRITQPNSES